MSGPVRFDPAAALPFCPFGGSAHAQCQFEFNEEAEQAIYCAVLLDLSAFERIDPAAEAYGSSWQQNPVAFLVAAPLHPAPAYVRRSHSDGRCIGLDKAGPTVGQAR
jgi:hypothetical protein